MGASAKIFSTVELSFALTILVTGGLLAAPTGSAALSLAPVATPGSLISSPASGHAVYYLAVDGKRYTFPNEKVYFSWYTDFSGVQMISDAELAMYHIGGNVDYRPGTRLVKITTDPKVYAVTPGGVLRWIPSEDMARRFYGPAWAELVDDLPDAFFAPPNYTIGQPLPHAGITYPTDTPPPAEASFERPEGLLVRPPSSATIYLIGPSGTKRPLVGQAAADATAHWDMYIQAINTDTLDSYSTGSDITEPIGISAEPWDCHLHTVYCM